MSCILFHGPTARQEALNETHRQGRLIAPPFEKLGIDDIREATDLLLSTPVGMGVGVIVIGPMDRMGSAKASDGLLKSIEEHSELMVPILWAHDLGGVSPTIKSRCLTRWCPQRGIPDDDEIQGDGRALVAAVLHDRLWEVPPLVKKYDVKDNKRLPELMGVIAQAVVSDWTPSGAALWERIREAARSPNVSAIEVVAALLPDEGDAS